MASCRSSIDFSFLQNFKKSLIAFYKLTGKKSLINLSDAEINKLKKKTTPWSIFLKSAQSVKDSGAL